MKKIKDNQKEYLETLIRRTWESIMKMEIPEETKNYIMELIPLPNYITDPSNSDIDEDFELMLGYPLDEEDEDF